MYYFSRSGVHGGIEDEIKNLSVIGDNCSALPAGFLPTTDQYLHTLNAGYLVCFSLCFVLMLLTIALYIESVVFLMRNLHNWKPKDKAIWLLGLYPVLSSTAFLAVIIPRSATLNDMVASSYLSLCVYLFVVMLMGHFGGQHKMTKKLASNYMKLQSPPMCCCCVCLPTVKVSTWRLRILEFMVLQFAILRPLLAYMAAVMWSNEKYISEDLVKDSSYTWINMVNIGSTLLALWGFSIVYGLSRAPLEKTAVTPKFLVLQIVMIISTFQHVVISVFAQIGVIPCEVMLTAKANADRWHHMIYVVEVFIISLVARNYYRRHVGDMPPEEQIIAETNDIETMTTNSLSRQSKPQYGAFSPQQTPVNRQPVSNNYYEPNSLATVSRSVGNQSSPGGFTDIRLQTTAAVSQTSKQGSSSNSASTSGNEAEEFISPIVIRSSGGNIRTPLSANTLSETGDIKSVSEIESDGAVENQPVEVAAVTLDIPDLNEMES